MNNLKSNKAMSHIQLLLLICVIVAIVISGIYIVKSKMNEEYIETIKTNMLLIQWKIKDLVEINTASGKEMTYIGTKLTDMSDSDELKDVMGKNIISSESYDKYYVLKDEDLKSLELEITNEKNSYYIVNYETGEILISKGCSYKKDELLYKLSDIENAKNAENDIEMNESEEQ